MPTNRPTTQEALHRLSTHPTVDIRDTAVLLGQGEATVRKAVDSGDIATIRLGRNFRVLSEPLRKQLALSDTPSE